MKRWIIRLSALSGIVVLGMIAIAHAQRDGGEPSQDADPAANKDPFSLGRKRAITAPQAVATDQPAVVHPDSEARFLSGDETRKLPENPVRSAPVSSNQESMFSAPANGPSDPFASRGGAVGRPAPTEMAGGPATTEIAVKPAPTFDPQVVPASATDDSAYSARSLPRTAIAPAATLPMDDHSAKPLSNDPLYAPAVGSNSASSGPNFGPPGTVSVMRRSPAATPTPTNVMRPINNEPAPLDGASTFAASELAAGAEGSGRPGDKQLEGSQSPHLTIEKIAPTEVQVGKPAKFTIKVRNAGTVEAQGVEIHDQVPQGTQLVSTNPPASQGPRGELIWSLGTLKPNDEVTAQMEVAPIAEGEIGSVASVSFRASASARTVATKPQLVMEVSSPKQVMIGGDVTFSIKLSNPGTGTASGVVLAEKVPSALRHPAGGELEFEVGLLKPGETRQIDLTMGAAQAGRVTNLLVARGDGKLRAEQKVDLEVLAPGLQVAMSGPSRRYLERQATYTVSVSNPGTAPARDVELVTQLPRGMHFVKANNSGHFDPNNNTVSWSLQELPASETGSVTLVAVPVEAGEQKLKTTGKARQGLSDEKEQNVTVEGLALVTYEVQASDDAVEIGGETSYQIHVVNQGSKAAENVQVAVTLPPELQAVGGQGPSHEIVRDHEVQFEPLGRLAPKGEATYRVRAKALKPGDLRVKVQLQTDDMRQPISKEACTRVYSDQ